MAAAASAAAAYLAADWWYGKMNDKPGDQAYRMNGERMLHGSVALIMTYGIRRASYGRRRYKPLQLAWHGVMATGVVAT